jgi:quinoprotein dehydrogenase-associated probable ABC transporter substrate-binding protein
MCSVSSRLASAFLVAGALTAMVVPVAWGGAAPAATNRTLRVCAAPNNQPFSDAQGKGFENAIARLLADDLHRPLAYTWWPQRRGFIRNTLKAGKCDVVIGVPAHLDMALTTVPYYRSSYVFVTRRDRHLDLRTMDDPRLRNLRIGVHAVGDDYANVPPAMALGRRGIVNNLHGYSIYGDYSKAAPSRALIDAVANGDIDVAIAWGPFAGYFAGEEKHPLTIQPVEGENDPTLPMSFAISMAVRKGDTAMRTVLDTFITRRHDAIAAVLKRYGIPVVPDRAMAFGRH